MDRSICVLQPRSGTRADSTRRSAAAFRALGLNVDTLDTGDSDFRRRLFSRSIESGSLFFSIGDFFDLSLNIHLHAENVGIFEKFGSRIFSVIDDIPYADTTIRKFLKAGTATHFFADTAETASAAAFVNATLADNTVALEPAGLNTAPFAAPTPAFDERDIDVLFAWPETATYPSFDALRARFGASDATFLAVVDATWETCMANPALSPLDAFRSAFQDALSRPFTVSRPIGGQDLGILHLAAAISDLVEAARRTAALAGLAPLSGDRRIVVVGTADRLPDLAARDGLRFVDASAAGAALATRAKATVVGTPRHAPASGLVDAASWGSAVVTASRPAAVPAFSDGVSILVADPPSGLADRLQSVDDNGLAEIAHAGAEIVRARYTIESRHRMMATAMGL